MPESSDLITQEEAMKLLNVQSRQTLYNLQRRGLLHSVKSQVGHGLGGRRVYFWRKEVEALLQPASDELPKPPSRKHRRDSV